MGKESLGEVERQGHLTESGGESPPPPRISGSEPVKLELGAGSGGRGGGVRLACAKALRQQKMRLKCFLYRQQMGE